MYIKIVFNSDENIDWVSAPKDIHSVIKAVVDGLSEVGAANALAQQGWKLTQVVTIVATERYGSNEGKVTTSKELWFEKNS